jgi:endonuclease YncB( thermonuclease family)
MMIRLGKRLLAAVGLALFPASAASAGDTLSGPIGAEVVRVIDGDTIEIRAQIWLQLALTSHVRVRGIDTPEMRGECFEEKAMAAAARDRLAELVGPALRLTNISDDKYFGRVVADVSAGDGTDIGAAMIASGLARPYDGETRGDWCATGSVTVGN